MQQAPLVRVIAQVRFPLITSLADPSFIAPFQEAIRGAYPVLRQEVAQGLAFGPRGPAVVSPQVTWKFHDLDEIWVVSLASTFIAIETTAYTSRADFLERLHVVLEALEAHVGPKTVDRLGVRYIDRVTGDDVEVIRDMVRGEVLGIVGTAMARHASHSISETLFTLGEDKMLARCGYLPAGASIDPAVEQVDVRSWILDLDMFSEAKRSFSPGELIEKARAFAERTYTFFRWAVTEEFLRRYGGDA